MVADLLGIGWAAIDIALEGLSDDWVEWFLHLEIQWRECHSEYD
jgi:hypothetical protein